MVEIGRVVSQIFAIFSGLFSEFFAFFSQKNTKLRAGEILLFWNFALKEALLKMV